MTSAYDLLDLKRLAIQEMENYSAKLDVFELLGAIKDRFQELDSESRVHALLHEKVKTAFEEDQTVFENEGFLKHLDNTALNRFMIKIVVGSYNDKVSRMLSTESELSQNLNHNLINQSSVEEAVPEQDVETQQNFITPLADEAVIDECCNRAATEQESACAEEFCTISCPSDDYLVMSSESPAEPEDCLTIVYTDEVYSSGQDCKPHSSIQDDSIDTPLVPTEDSPQEELEDAEFAPEPISESISEALPVPESEVKVDPFAGLSKSQKKKLQQKMKEEAKNATWSAHQDIAFDPECMPVDVQNGQENYFDQPIKDDDGQCPFRARHLLEENMWKDCRSCRNVVRQMARQAVRVTLDSEQFHEALENLLIAK